MNRTRRTACVLGLAILTIGSLNLTAQGRQNPSANARMTGTYELESSRSGDPRRAAEAATRSLPQGQRDRAYQSLLARLEAPETLSIDRRGQTITIASSRGPRSAFDADGRTQSERGPNGQLINTRAQLVGNQLRVSTSGGDRGSDFLVTFESIGNGDRLRVTRRLDNEDLQRPVTLQSYYRRTDVRPDWDVYANASGNQSEDGRGSGRGAGRGSGRGYDGGYGTNDRPMVVPDGTRIMATLDAAVSTRPARDTDSFTMTVRSPSEFEGARITATMSRADAGGENDTRNDMRVDFQTIEVRGRSSAFNAVLNTIRLSDGTLLRVNGDRMNSDSDDDRGGNTVRNGAVGVGVGAVIGAIAGGVKGAAIGAAVGGVGGVIVSQGGAPRDLPRGAEMNLTAVSRYRTP